MKNYTTFMLRQDDVEIPFCVANADITPDYDWTSVVNNMLGILKERKEYLASKNKK